MNRWKKQKFASLFLVFAGLAGCQSAPPGDSGGRMDAYSTPAAEQKSRQAHTADLLSFSDATVDQIVSDLASLKTQLDPNTKYTLYLGELENQTSATPTGDFEMFQKRIRGKLVNEPRVRDVFAIRNDPTGAVRQAQRVAAPAKQRARDPLQEHGRPSEGLTGMNVAVDPAYQFVLTGTFHDAVREGSSLFYIEFEVVNVGTGDIVISSSKDLHQRG